MIEIRFHGRGGQGAVTSAELLALAAIGEGKYAQAFPSFGPERRGAPVVAFCRISDQPIKIRANIYEPDIVVVLDASLLKIVNVAAGLKPKGIIVTTSKDSPEKVKAGSEDQKSNRRGGCGQDCHGGSRTSHHQYDHAGLFGQGFGKLVKKESFIAPFEGAVWPNCRKEHLLPFERAYSKYSAHSL